MAENSLETRVALIEKDITNLGQLVGKFDIALERITNISSDVKEMLAGHEIRLNTQESVIKSFFDKKEDLEDEIAKQDKALREFVAKQREEIEEKIEKESDRINKLNYVKYFIMGVAVLILAKLQIPLPAL